MGNTILDDTYCTEGLFENLDKNAKMLSRKWHSFKLLLNPRLKFRIPTLDKTLFL